VITLKEALALPKEEIAALRDDLKKSIEEKKELNAYISVDEAGEGVPLLIKIIFRSKGGILPVQVKFCRGMWHHTMQQ